MEKLTAAKFRFGNFEMDCARRSLTRDGELVELNAKAFDLLQQLVENQGRLVTKDELLERVWPGQFVEENNLTVQISAIRKAFGERKGEHTFITTVSGRGYSFVENVERFELEKSVVENDVAESIFGRADEIAEIKRLLRPGDDGVRLIVLTGAGGSGKTKLAQAAASELSAEFPDGVFFVELAAVNNAELVVSAIAKTLGLEESGDARPIEALKAFLRERQMLLTLDNFEHLVSAVPLLKEILASSSTLRILVTSRVALRLVNERDFAVLPLPVPPKDRELSPEELKEYPAVSLFVARATTAKPSFSLTQTNASDVAEICRRLDGLPLAIELAAARLKLLSTQSILSRLEHSLNLLTGGAKDLAEHHRTMRGTIQWSYELLDGEEKALFRRLAAFAGGFTVEAAEAIVEKDKVRERGEGKISEETGLVSAASHTAISAPVLDLLTSLVDNNLLVSKEQTDGDARLQMLEVVREFAFEMLQEANELDDVSRIHARFFLAVAEDAEPFLYGEKGIEWLSKLENEHDNFRAALSWSLKDDHEIAARLTATLGFLWLCHSHFREGLGWCNAAVEATKDTISEARAKTLVHTGIFIRHRGELEAARTVSEKCLRESRALNDSALIQKAVHGLGCIAVLQKDYAAADGYYQEALSLSRETNDERRIAYTLGSLGDLEMCKGNQSAARVFLEECRTLSEKLGDKPVQTTIYYNLGAIDYFEGLYQDAALKFARSLRICEEMGFKTMMSCALDGFAALSAVSGDLERSAKLAGAVDSLRESISFNNQPAEENFREEYMTKVRTLLDEKTFAAHYAEGKEMKLEAAIAMTAEPKLLGRDEGKAFYLNESISEVVIETHSFSRIVIEEEVDKN